MPKFYFHVCQGDARFEDHLGADLCTPLAAWRWAVEDARILIAQKVLDGQITEQWVEITDAKGVVIATMPFGRAVQLH